MYKPITKRRQFACHCQRGINIQIFYFKKRVFKRLKIAGAHSTPPMQPIKRFNDTFQLQPQNREAKRNSKPRDPSNG